MKAYYSLFKVEGYEKFVFSRKVITEHDNEINATRTITKEEAEMYLGRAMMKGLNIQSQTIWENTCWKWEQELK